MTAVDLHQLKQQIGDWAQELGFQQLAVSDLDLSEHENHLKRWLEQGFHGTMSWMENHLEKRCHPELLQPGTVRVITARMDYRPEQIPLIPEDGDNSALISCYAHGRDYHKTIRARLTQLAKTINAHTPHEYRAFVDSAPVLERALAEKSGLGWIGKNTMLINKDAGSWFFLGELFTNLPLPTDADEGKVDNQNHCGTCTACLDECPTGAIVAPNQVDARKCISYLTIEYDGSIPIELRPLIGNRIFGCDDCQVACPWNKFSAATRAKDFTARDYVKQKSLAELFLWTEEEFLKQTEGSPIRRTGYRNWLRNIAVALGNAENNDINQQALLQRKDHSDELIREHTRWALETIQAINT